LFSHNYESEELCYAVQISESRIGRRIQCTPDYPDEHDNREYTVSLKSRYLLALLGGFHPPTGGTGRGLGPVAPGGGGGAIGGGGGPAPEPPIGGGGGGGMPPCMAGGGGGGGGIAISVIDTSGGGSGGGGGGTPHILSIGVGGGGGGGIPLMMPFMDSLVMF
jgi:hypothetical protein